MSAHLQESATLSWHSCEILFYTFCSRLCSSRIDRSIDAIGHGNSQVNDIPPLIAQFLVICLKKGSSKCRGIRDAVINRRGKGLDVMDLGSFLLARFVYQQTSLMWESIDDTTYILFLIEKHSLPLIWIKVTHISKQVLSKANVTHKGGLMASGPRNRPMYSTRTFKYPPPYFVKP